MQSVEDDVTKDVAMESADLPEESKPESKPATRSGGVWAWRPVQFVRDVRLELKKVTWPTRSEVLSTTVVVMIAVVFFSAYLWGVDNLLEVFFKQIESWLSS